MDRGHQDTHEKALSRLLEECIESWKPGGRWEVGIALRASGWTPFVIAAVPGDIQQRVSQGTRKYACVLGNGIGFRILGNTVDGSDIVRATVIVDVAFRAVASLSDARAATRYLRVPSST